MKVSIIIPVYNAEKYLEECINSALNQTFQDIEIIAVDDGSTDNSPKILKKYSDKIKIITKTNGGTATALNAGINKATGEWIKWLSADDALYPNAVKELILEAEKLQNKKNVILYSNYDKIDSSGEVIKQFIEPNYNDMNSFDFNVILLDHFIGNGTTCLIHKSAFNKYGYFDEKIGFQEDYELWLRFCLQFNCRLHLIPKILAKYRIHEKQLTMVKVDKNLENTEQIRKLVLGRLSQEERQKYEIALFQYEKSSIKVQFRNFIKHILFETLPWSVSKHLVDVYRSLKYNKNLFSNN